MLTGVRLSRSWYLYEPVRFTFFANLVVSFALNSVLTTRPFNALTGTTGVVSSVRNVSF